jgi:LysR family transcriptional activator of nhaA
MNFKHLHYFWTVARSGGVARAGERLHLTPQTISAQVKLLEQDLGSALFQASGRGLELTDAGRLALGYADEIFALGDELLAALESKRERPYLPFRVGITDVVPKAIAYRLLEPAEREISGLRLICREGKLDRLLAELALHRLDLVIADRPIPANINVRGYSQKLGESEIAFFASPGLIDPAAPFPACLGHVPMLLPGDDSTVRGQIERWLDSLRLAPRIAGEFDDDALMRAFGQAGGGCFPGPAALADEIQTQYGVSLLGRTGSVHEAFYAITSERRTSHPAIPAVTGSAQDFLAQSQAPGVRSGTSA